jgi:ribonuclease HI
VPGRDETVDELRIEVVFPRRLRRRVTGTYVAAHPYEEPAYDVIPLDNEIASLGLGRLGALPRPSTLAELAAEVAAVLRLPSVRYSGDAGRQVRRVAVLPGSGAEAIARGVAQVADVLITGDVKYHEARAAQAQGLALIDAPHGVTEQEGMLRWARRLADALGSAATVETFRNAAVAVWSDSDGRVGAAVSARATENAHDEAGEPAVPEVAAPAPTEGVRSVNRDDDRYHLYTDGGARGNPGPAGIGARLMTAGGDVVEDVSDYIGKATNNVAEYQALIAGLEIALDRGVERLDVFLDSELVVRQVNGRYKVKDAGLKPLHQQACLLLSRFHEVDVKHVRREQNAAADALVNQAIDAAAG